MILNDNSVYLNNRVKELDNILTILKHFFVFHFIYLFSLTPAYLVASDYLDCLEIGETPPVGSENWAAPFIKSIFSKYIMPVRPDLAKALMNSIDIELN